MTHKTKTRAIPETEYLALLYKVIDAAGHGRGYETKFAMITDDFLPTQCMAEVRYMAWDNAHDCGLFQIDNAGDAILLVRKDD
jgi:hypothetical protein